MYLDLNEVTYDEKNGEVILKGIDLDSIILKDWNEALSEAENEVTMKFNLDWKGNRLYLYRILKTTFRDQSKFETMKDMVLALNGRVVNISKNFLVKAED